MDARNRAVVGGDVGHNADGEAMRRRVGGVSCREIAALNAYYKRPGMNAT